MAAGRCQCPRSVGDVGCWPKELEDASWNAPREQGYRDEEEDEVLCEFQAVVLA
ncbi:MAG: hypothetical protein JWP17_215 [Solirubrobacterales bacterium]|nr:hypothetical protein [Solirubrobacterales bacterium]